MNIQKEREMFEAWVGSNGRSIERFSDGSYKSMTLDKEWEAWQAAKAQAIPDGFVIVPKEPTPRMIEAGMGNFCFPIDNGRFYNHDLIFAYRAMVEAQEQNGVNNEPN